MSAAIIVPSFGSAIPGGSGGGTGVTRRAARNALADQLGIFHSTTVTSSAAGLDQARVVLAEELRDDEDEDDTYGRMYLYVVDGDQAGEQRRVLQRGYRGLHGGLILSRPFTTALEEETTIEVTFPLPVARIRQRKGLNTILDEAAKLIVIEARLPFTGDGTRTVDLGAYPWLFSIEQTRGIYDNRLTAMPGDPTQFSSTPYTIAANGASRSLVPGTIYSSGETFELAVSVRASNLVYSGGTWGYDDGGGLTSDDDMIAAPESWLVAFGMVKALQHLRTLIGLDRSLSKEERAIHLDDVERRMRVWAPAAADIKRIAFPSPVQEFASGVLGGITNDQQANASLVPIQPV